MGCRNSIGKLHLRVHRENVAHGKKFFSPPSLSLSFSYCNIKHPTAGFAGDDAPRSVFPSLIGRARQPGIMVR
jgi:hypothetical protein